MTTTTTKLQYKDALGHLKTAEKRLRQDDPESARTWIGLAHAVILTMSEGSPKRRELEARLLDILKTMRGGA